MESTNSLTANFLIEREKNYASVLNFRIKKGEVLDTIDFIKLLNLEITAKTLKQHKKTIGKYIYAFHIENSSQKWT